MWIEDDAWMEDLLNQKRKLRATWEASSRAVHSPELTTGSSPGLPDSLSFVALNTHARSVSRGYVRIEYRFSNYEACLEAVKLKKHANL